MVIDVMHEAAPAQKPEHPAIQNAAAQAWEPGRLDGRITPTGDVLTNQQVLTLHSGDQLTIGNDWSLKAPDGKEIENGKLTADRGIYDADLGVHVINEGNGTSTIYDGAETIKIQYNDALDFHAIDVTVDYNGKEFKTGVVNSTEASKSQI